MLDRSGSMTDLTGAGRANGTRCATRSRNSWRQAFRGLGVAFNIFRSVNRCARDVHERHGLRRAGRRMSTKACEPSAFSSFPFTCAERRRVSADSAGCVAYGVSKASALACFSLGAGDAAPSACNAPVAECLNSLRATWQLTRARRCDCSAAGNEPALRTSLQAETPIGLTPTSLPSPARWQAAEHARQPVRNTAYRRARDDGTPTQCDPLDVTGSPTSPRTHCRNARGPDLRDRVFAERHRPRQPRCWAKAAAASLLRRGSRLGREQPVPGRAREDSRGNIACEYLLPPAPWAASSISDASTSRSARHERSRPDYVGDAKHCTSKQLGWYYDAPLPAARRRRSSSAAKAADMLKAIANARIDIRLGWHDDGPD